MAAKKKKAGAKSAARKKTASNAKSAARKKTASKKKASATKKASPRKKAPAAKKKAAAPAKATSKTKPPAKETAAGAKEPVSAAAPTPPTPPTPPTAPATTPESEGAFSALDVNLGHVFRLRPRVNTSFRQNDFLEARRTLAEKRFPSLEEAARTIADEALSRTRGSAARPEHQRRR